MGYLSFEEWRLRQARCCRLTVHLSFQDQRVWLDFARRIPAPMAANDPTLYAIRKR